VHSEVSRNRNELASETGSGIVGFVLVAPLVVAIFIAIGQIAMLVADKSVLNSAAVIGARTASASSRFYQAEALGLVQKQLSLLK